MGNDYDSDNFAPNINAVARALRTIYERFHAMYFDYEQFSNALIAIYEQQDEKDIVEDESLKDFLHEFRITDGRCGE